MPQIRSKFCAPEYKGSRGTRGLAEGANWRGNRRRSSFVARVRVTMARRRRRTPRHCARASRAGRRAAFECLEPRMPLAAQPIINEILAGNDGVILDVDGDESDFVEIYNAGDAEINLTGWHL